MTSNFCKTSWHPYGHLPEECPDCKLCHEPKIKKLGNNEGVQMSSTVGGQRELIRQHRNKINELVEAFNKLSDKDVNGGEQDKRILRLIDDVRSRVNPPEQEEWESLFRNLLAYYVVEDDPQASDMIVNHVKANFISKEKIKDVSNYVANQYALGHEERSLISRIIKSLGLDL